MGAMVAMVAIGVIFATGAMDATATGRPRC
jgi:hypothetical protein